MHYSYRLKRAEVQYILEHSESKLILVDHEFLSLVEGTTNIPVIVSKDTGRDNVGDLYEEFLSKPLNDQQSANDPAR